MEQKLIRIEYPGDPEQCQAVGKHGQCPYKRVTGSNNCQRHGGNKAVQAAEKNEANMYKIQTYQKRLEELAEHEKVKSLREEIGLLRILMEETVNKCNNSNELLLYSGRIADLAIRIEKLVVSCNKTEEKMGMLMDKSAALALAGQIVTIISTHVTDPDTVDAISSSIIDVISKLGSNT